MKSTYTVGFYYGIAGTGKILPSNLNQLFWKKKYLFLAFKLPKTYFLLSTEQIYQNPTNSNRTQDNFFNKYNFYFSNLLPFSKRFTSLQRKYASHNTNIGGWVRCLALTELQ